ncbi:Alcohol dehydrogenase [Pseudonocardia sp. Ae707_Ps1]|nr:Alcohol dehydrogenase [Pseudonocardia sp. Ae707_Ps1]
MTGINVARLVEVGRPLQVGTATKPAPGPREVLVRVAACGLVPNSDNVVNGRTPFTLPELPAIFGLDVSGTIEAVGEHVLNLAAGQRVYVDPHLVCGTCHQCRRGRTDLCPNGCLRGYFASSPGGAKLLGRYEFGGLSEYVVAEDRNIAVLPDSIDLDTAARFGYVGTSFGALKKGRLGPSKTLLVNGVTGTLGVAAVAIALGMGATRILGVGRNQALLQRINALAPGRIATVSSEDGVDLPKWTLDQTDGLGVDVMYDCLGVGGDGNTTDALRRAVKAGGRTILAAGGVDADLTETYAEAMSRDTATLGSGWFDAGEADEMIAMIGAGIIDLSILEHKVFPLAQVNEAFTFVGDRPGGFANVVVRPRPDIHQVD